MIDAVLHNQLKVAELIILLRRRRLLLLRFHTRIDIISFHRFFLRVGQLAPWRENFLFIVLAGRHERADIASSLLLGQLPSEIIALKVYLLKFVLLYYLSNGVTMVVRKILLLLLVVPAAGDVLRLVVVFIVSVRCEAQSGLVVGILFHIGHVLRNVFLDLRNILEASLVLVESVDLLAVRIDSPSVFREFAFVSRLRMIVN